MSINIFNHPYKAQVNKQLEPITRDLRPGDSITAIHTPIVLPLTTNEVGGYARSISLFFGPKWIALNCHRFEKESDFMKKFILTRQVALFDKSNRCLYTPLAAISIAIAFVASTILFSSSLAVVGITTLVAGTSANLVAKKEQENEKYADQIAFRNASQIDKENILKFLKEKEEKKTSFSFLKDFFSSYPSYADRYNQLVKDEFTNSIKLENHYPSDDLTEEAIANCSDQSDQLADDLIEEAIGN